MLPSHIAIKVVAVISLLIAIFSVAIGFSGELTYLNLVLDAVTVCLLAGLLFMSERIEKKIGRARGITPVISVVLLLMMTVAVAGIAWFWLQGMTGTLLNTTDEVASVSLCSATLDIDFGGSKVYCADGKVTALGLQLAIDSGIGVVFKGLKIGDFVVEGSDFEGVRIDEPLGSGEYKEILIKNEAAKYTGAELENAGDSAELQIEVKTNCGKSTAIMTFNSASSISTTCK